MLGHDYGLRPELFHDVVKNTRVELAHHYSWGTFLHTKSGLLIPIETAK